MCSWDYDYSEFDNDSSGFELFIGDEGFYEEMDGELQEKTVINDSCDQKSRIILIQQFKREMLEPENANSENQKEKSQENSNSIETSEFVRELQAHSIAQFEGVKDWIKFSLFPSLNSK